MACCPVPAAVCGTFGCGLFASWSFRSEHGTGQRASAARQADQRCPGVPQQCRQRKAVDCAGPAPPHLPAPVRPRSLRPSFCCDKAKQAVHPAYPLKTDGYAPQPPDSAADRGCPPAVTQCPKPCRSDTASDDGPPWGSNTGLQPRTSSSTSAQQDHRRGEVPERSNGAVSKTVDPLRGPRVRIPVSPPVNQADMLILKEY